MFYKDLVLRSCLQTKIKTGIIFFHDDSTITPPQLTPPYNNNK